MTKSNKKKIFPIGIFIILFTILSLLSITISSSYFYYTIKKSVRNIEKNTQDYSMTMAEAFARVAELSYPSKKYSKLKDLFHDKIHENIIDEAFFVLSDGKIIVHSRKEIAKKLKGNIANDEFAYNIDLILLPLRNRSKETQFIDYNIISNKIPFDKNQRSLIKKYVYKKIDITGWLTTRAVFVKNNPIGTVNFIISKDRIYNNIFLLLEESIKLLILLSIISFTISIFISLIIYIRYRTIAKGSIEEPFIEQKEEKLLDLPKDSFIIQELEVDKKTARDIQNEEEKVEISAGEVSMAIEENIEPSVITPAILHEEKTKIDTSRVIKDAIPVRKQE